MTRSVRLFGTFALAASIGLTACGNKTAAPPPAAPAPPPAPQQAPPPPPPAPPAPPAPAPAPAPTDDEIFAKKTVDELNADKPLGDAFFDLDSSQIRDDAKPDLQKDADWMKRWTSTKVTIEGHCDNRGTPEYNLALGSRRAAAVKDYLVNLGIAVDRIQTVSKGEDQPFCADNTEECWQQNRRGHFIITEK